MGFWDRTQMTQKISFTLMTTKSICRQPANTEDENPEKKLVNGLDVLTFLQGVNVCMIYLWVQLDEKGLFG